MWQIYNNKDPGNNSNVRQHRLAESAVAQIQRSLRSRRVDGEGGGRRDTTQSVKRETWSGLLGGPLVRHGRGNTQTALDFPKETRKGHVKSCYAEGGEGKEAGGTGTDPLGLGQRARLCDSDVGILRVATATC